MIPRAGNDKSEQVRRISPMNPVLMHSAMLPSKVEKPDGNVLDALGLRPVCRFIVRASSVRLFFLSDSEEENIKSTLNVLQDKAFAAAAFELRKDLQNSANQ